MSAILKEDPKKVAQLLAYAATFPDFKGFNPPDLSDPNYIPPSNSAIVIIYAYILAGITTLTVILRLWIRRRVQGMVFGWDDYLIIPGQLFTLGMITIMILLMRVGGVGMHVYDLTLDRINKTQTLQFAGIQVYMTAVFFVRLSITALLYRLMGHSSKIKQWLLHATVIILVAEWIVQIPAFVFATKPISAAWDFNVRLNGFEQTVNAPLEVFILTILYFVMDVWLLVFPIHTIWTLQLPLRTRISASMVFIFGGVACAGAIVKTIYIYPAFNSYDSTWHGTSFIAGALTEIGFGVISSSMPALNHILVKVLPRTLGSWFTKSNSKPKSSTGSGQRLGKNNAANNSKNNTKTETIHVSPFTDKHFYNPEHTPSPSTINLSHFTDKHFYNPEHTPSPSTINFSRKTSMREMSTDERRDDAVYSPAWLRGSFANRGDLESQDIELSRTVTGTGTVTPVRTVENEDVHSTSWLSVR